MEEFGFSSYSLHFEEVSPSKDVRLSYYYKEIRLSNFSVDSCIIWLETEYSTHFMFEIMRQPSGRQSFDSHSHQVVLYDNLIPSVRIELEPLESVTLIVRLSALPTTSTSLIKTVGRIKAVRLGATANLRSNPIYITVTATIVTSLLFVDCSAIKLRPPTFGAEVRRNIQLWNRSECELLFKIIALESESSFNCCLSLIDFETGAVLPLDETLHLSSFATKQIQVVGSTQSSSKQTQSYRFVNIKNPENFHDITCSVQCTNKVVSSAVVFSHFGKSDDQIELLQETELLFGKCFSDQILSRIIRLQNISSSRIPVLLSSPGPELSFEVLNSKYPSLASDKSVSGVGCSSSSSSSSRLALYSNCKDPVVDDLKSEFQRCPNVSESKDCCTWSALEVNISSKVSEMFADCGCAWGEPDQSVVYTDAFKKSRRGDRFLINYSSQVPSDPSELSELFPVLGDQDSVIVLEPLSSATVSLNWRAVSAYDEQCVTGQLLRRESAIKVLWHQVLDQNLVPFSKEFSCVKFCCERTLKVHPQEIDFGSCNIGEFKSADLILSNDSELESIVSVLVQSESLSIHGDPHIIIPARSSVVVGVEYVAREENAGYRRAISFSDGCNSLEIQVKAKNIDKHQVLLHSQLYKIQTFNSQRLPQVYIDKCFYNIPNLRLFTILNLYSSPLTFRISSDSDDLSLRIAQSTLQGSHADIIGLDSALDCLCSMSSPSFPLSDPAAIAGPVDVSKVRVLYSQFKELLMQKEYLLPLEENGIQDVITVPPSATIVLVAVFSPSRPKSDTEMETASDSLLRNIRIEVLNLSHDEALTHLHLNDALVDALQPVPQPLKPRLLLLRAKAVESRFVLLQRNVNFGNVGVGCTEVRTVTIVNKSFTDCYFYISKSRNFASGFLNICGSHFGVISAGESKLITFKFKPTMCELFEEVVLIENVLNPECSVAILFKAVVSKANMFELCPFDEKKAQIDFKFSEEVNQLRNLLHTLHYDPVTVGEMPIESQRKVVVFRLKNLSNKKRRFVIDVKHLEVVGVMPSSSGFLNFHDVVSFKLICNFKELSDPDKIINLSEKEKLEDELEFWQRKLRIAIRKGKIKKISIAEKNIADISARLSVSGGGAVALSPTAPATCATEVATTSSGSRDDVAIAMINEDNDDDIEFITPLLAVETGRLTTASNCSALADIDAGQGIIICLETTFKKTTSSLNEVKATSCLGIIRVFENRNEDTTKTLHFGMIVSAPSPESRLEEDSVTPRLRGTENRDILMVTNSISLGEVPLGSSSRTTLAIENTSSDLSAFFSIRIGDSNQSIGELQCDGDCRGIISLDPLSVYTCELTFSAIGIGKFESQIWVTSTSVDVEFLSKSCSLTATVFASPSEFIEIDGIEKVSAAPGVYAPLDFGNIQISHDGCAVDECVRTLKIKNISGISLAVSAASNLKSQCVVYSDESCVTPTVESPLAIGDECMLYVQIRPSSSRTGRWNKEELADAAREQPTTSEYKFSDKETLRGRELKGGIRLIFFSREMSKSVDSAIVGYPIRKLFEVSVSFKAVIGASKIRIFNISPEVLECRPPTSDSVDCVSGKESSPTRAHGSFTLENVSPTFPVQYSYLSDPFLKFQRSASSSEDEIPQREFILLFDDIDGHLSPKERKVINFALFIDGPTFGYKKLKIQIRNNFTGELENFSIGIKVDEPIIVSTVVSLKHFPNESHETSSTMLSHDIWVYPISSDAIDPSRKPAAGANDRPLELEVLGSLSRVLSIVHLQNNSANRFHLSPFTNMPLLVNQIKHSSDSSEAEVIFIKDSKSDVHDKIRNRNRELSAKKISLHRSREVGGKSDKESSDWKLGRAVPGFHKCGSSFFLEPFCSISLELYSCIGEHLTPEIVVESKFFRNGGVFTSGIIGFCNNVPLSDTNGTPELSSLFQENPTSLIMNGIENTGLLPLCGISRISCSLSIPLIQITASGSGIMISKDSPKSNSELLTIYNLSNTGIPVRLDSPELLVRGCKPVLTFTYGYEAMESFHLSEWAESPCVILVPPNATVIIFGKITGLESSERLMFDHPISIKNIALDQYSQTNNCDGIKAHFDFQFSISVEPQSFAILHDDFKSLQVGQLVETSGENLPTANLYLSLNVPLSVPDRRGLPAQAVRVATASERPQDLVNFIVSNNERFNSQFKVSVKVSPLLEDILTLKLLFNEDSQLQASKFLLTPDEKIVLQLQAETSYIGRIVDREACGGEVSVAALASLLYVAMGKPNNSELEINSEVLPRRWEHGVYGPILLGSLSLLSQQKSKDEVEVQSRLGPAVSPIQLCIDIVGYLHAGSTVSLPELQSPAEKRILFLSPSVEPNTFKLEENNVTFRASSFSLGQRQKLNFTGQPCRIPGLQLLLPIRSVHHEQILSSNSGYFDTITLSCCITDTDSVSEHVILCSIIGSAAATVPSYMTKSSTSHSWRHRESEGLFWIMDAKILVTDTGYPLHDPAEIIIPIFSIQPVKRLMANPVSKTDRHKLHLGGIQSHSILEVFQAGAATPNPASAVPVSMLRLRGASRQSATNSQYEVNLGQQVQTEEFIEWAVTLENCSSFDDLSYDVRLISSFDDWLFCSHSRGYLQVLGSATLYLYISRSALGRFVADVLIENCSSEQPTQIIHVRIDVISHN